MRSLGSDTDGVSSILRAHSGNDVEEATVERSAHYNTTILLHYVLAIFKYYGASPTIASPDLADNLGEGRARILNVSYACNCVRVCSSLGYLDDVLVII